MKRILYYINYIFLIIAGIIYTGCTKDLEVVVVSSVTLNTTSMTLVEGESQSLVATVSPSNAENKMVLWTSSNSSVATVDNGVVTAIKPGNAIITAISDDGGKTAVCTVTVVAKVHHVEKVEVDIESATLNEGDTILLTATIKPENATNKNVFWKSSNESVAKVSNGEVTALKAGTATITVTSEDGNKSATCEIIVNALVSSVSLDKTEVALTEGDTTTLVAIINPENATNKNVTWSSSDTSVATVSNGTVTALKAGTAIITVITEDGSKTATCKVTVNEKIYPVQGVSLDRTSATLNEGEALTLTATINPENATNKNVTWSSGDTSVATVSNGTVTALKAGTAIITVTTEDGGKTATCQVTVNEKIYPVQGVSLDRTSATLNEGEALTLTATINPENATNKSVTWSSSNTSVATISDGVVTALNTGIATITVTTDDGGKTASCTVTVIEKVISVSLDKAEVALTEGDTTTLVAIINPEDATNKNVTWSSSDTSVATVSNGTVTALKAGTTTITVITEDGGKTATCKVTVNEKIYPVTGITLSQSTLTINEGDTYTLIATIAPNNATNKNVSWNSSNNSVATVSNGVITALNIGTTTITAITEDGGMTANCVVTVIAEVADVSLDKYEATLCENEVITLTATISPDHATNKNVTWNSSNTSVATVSANGVVTALKAGTTIITVTTEDGGKTATCYITVIAKVASISLNKTSATLTEGDKLTLTATISPSNATNKNVTWKSSNTSVATVSANGVVTALKAGTTTITVTSQDGNKTATCSVTVKEKVYPVTGVTLNKTAAEIVIGNKLTLTATVKPTNATNKDVMWSSSNTNVATVSSSGQVLACSTGTANIVVTTEDGKYTAQCKVTVVEKVVSGGNEGTSDEDWGI